jgi:membrane-bound lytic murein transglycosylase F
MLKLFLGILLLLAGCQNSEAPQESSFPVRALSGEKPESYKSSVQKKRFLISDAVQQKINRYESIVKKYAKRYGFDWRLIMAQIRQESKFNERAKSRVGAHGLMQIMPRTLTELRNELDIEHIYQNPRENIAAGVYHLYKQYRSLQSVKDREERLKMSLAAYNAGLGRIIDARNIAAFLFNDDQHWAAVKKALFRLTRKDWQLHLQVWADGKPPHGYFKGAGETTGYVDAIFDFYRTYLAFY